MRLSPLASIGLLALASAQDFAPPAAYTDSITGSSILGSHFGVPGFDEAFDYVIVGGGTTGLALATRLAQQGNQVAVVEAGGFYEIDNGNLTQIPGKAAYFVGKNPVLRNPNIDWGLQTTPQPGVNGASFLYAAGKTFGGSSARNYLLYQRATVGSYQKWADQVGDQSYTWNNILPYFKKSVNFQPANNQYRLANASITAPSAPYSPTGGPLHVSYPNWSNALSSWVVKSLNALGLKQIPDFVSGQLKGFAYVAATMENAQQTRDSSSSSFLRAGIQTTKMVLYPYTLGKKVVFNANKTATGVLVSRNGVNFTLSAHKEVIISAGTFRSPQLLMASGIGPKATLDKFGIPVIKDLPGVGQNLTDHTIFGTSWAVNVYTHSRLGDEAFSEGQEAAYLANRTGILTSNGADLLGWENFPAPLASTLSKDIQSALAAYPSDWPDLELLFSDGYSGTQTDFLYGAPRDNFQYASASAALVKPFGRGNVTLASADTAVNPIINPNLLGDPRDQAVAVAAFKRARQLFQTSAMAPVIIGQEAYPGPAVATDAQILANLKLQAGVVYHAAATCHMGVASDPQAVVDSSARVFGVNRLRVVDASALPFLPPGHPQATLYMLAEKIVDVIQTQDCDL